MGERTPDRSPDLGKLVWLAQIVIGPFVNRLNGGVDRGERGHDDDWNVISPCLQRSQQFNSAHALHSHIRENKVKRSMVKSTECLFGARRSRYRISFFFENADERHTGVHVIV